MHIVQRVIIDQICGHHQRRFDSSQSFTVCVVVVVVDSKKHGSSDAAATCSSTTHINTGLRDTMFLQTRALSLGIKIKHTKDN